MISKTAVRIFPPGSCTPRFKSRSCVGGLCIPLKRFRNNVGMHWSWSGSSPHDTRMHRYGGLASGDKTAWKAVADDMNNGHSIVTPLPYSGAIAFMVINLARRLKGDGYSDAAPASPPPSSSLPAQVQNDPFPPGFILVEPI